MLNGLWSVTFSAQGNSGSGVVAVVNNQILGGDSGFSYIGNISTNPDGTIAGEVNVSRHTSGLPSIIPGIDQYSMKYAGKMENGVLTMTGHVKNNPNISISVHGRKIASLTN